MCDTLLKEIYFSALIKSSKIERFLNEEYAHMFNAESRPTSFFYFTCLNSVNYLNFGPSSILPKKWLKDIGIINLEERRFGCFMRLESVHVRLSQGRNTGLTCKVS